MTSFFKKRGAPLGQHVLTSPAIARAIVEAAEVSRGDYVLEVGPGRGILTRELLDSGACVIAVEKDPDMCRATREAFPEAAANGRLVLVEGDIRDLLGVGALPLPAPFKVVANIPYYLTGELVRALLTLVCQPSAISILVQKEVAERIARDQKESLLSLSVKAYGSPRYIRTVKAGSFSPPPSVDSAILLIKDISRSRFENVSEENFFAILRAGFGQKRKTLKGNLERAGLVSRQEVETLWKRLGCNANIRAEDVPLPLWFTLAGTIRRS